MALLALGPARELDANHSVPVNFQSIAITGNPGRRDRAVLLQELPDGTRLNPEMRPLTPRS